MGQLEGKVALITGASKGIGRVMSRLFAREGAAVVCAARSRDLLEETVALIKGDGGRALAVTGDAATEADVQTMIAAGVKAFGKLDVLVNNAGAKSMTGMSRVASSTFFTARDLRMFMTGLGLRPES